jgi:hypothetical protein
MNIQWIEARILEEQERRQREDNILKRLPSALEELYDSLKECVDSYKNAFGPRSATIQLGAGRLRVEVRDEVDGKWTARAEILVSHDLTIPGFRIERGGEPYLVEVGVLSGDKLSYRDGDEYLTLEELTRRILDRAMFPKLVA